MTFNTKPRFSLAAFAISAAAVTVLNGSKLMGFDQLASNGHNNLTTSARLAKSNTVPRTVTLERVVISTRRV
jgi:hypothetical protein